MKTKIQSSYWSDGFRVPSVYADVTEIQVRINGKRKLTMTIESSLLKGEHLDDQLYSIMKEFKKVLVAKGEGKTPTL